MLANVLKSTSQNIKAFACRHHATILTYHGVSPGSLPFPMWTQMSRERFEQHMSWLASNYNCVNVTTLLAQHASGTIAPRTVCVTFDDGFLNNYTTALPIQKKYNIPSTLFVAAGYVGSNRLIWPDRLASIIATQSGKLIVTFGGASHYVGTPTDCAKTYRSLVTSLKKLHPDAIDSELLRFADENEVDIATLHNVPWFDVFRIADWYHLKEMCNSGLVEIGSHTINHTIVSRLTIDEASREITESRKMLESNIDVVPYFAYPNGGVSDFSNEHRDIAIGAGYRAVLTSIAGTFTKNSDPFHIHRIGVGADTAVSELDYTLRIGAAYSGGTSVTRLAVGLVSGTIDR